MTAVSPAEREQMCSVLGGFGADLKQLDDSAVDALWKAGYRSEDLLQIATHKGLKDAGLLPAYVDYVLSLKGGGSRSAPDAGQPRDQQEDTGMQRVAASSKFTGRVPYDKVDPKTKQVSRLPSCVIVIAPKFAATFAHHRTWSEGQDVELEMYCSDANSMRAVPAKVFRIDTRVDFVILKFVGEELPAPAVAGGPQAGTGFYGHGLSLGGNTANVYHGIVARPAAGSRGHVALDKLSTKGDSGGGIFSAATGQLLGMMVGRDQEREISYMVPAAVLLAATAEDNFDPDPPPSGEWM